MTRQQRDAGFTLPELLVFVVLSGIVGTLVAASAHTGFQQQRKITDRNVALANTRTALERIDRDIRSADPVLAATQTQLIVEENEPSQTRTMTYSVVADTGNHSKIVVNETDVTAGVSRVRTQRTLLTQLVNTDTHPVFSYSARPSPYIAPTGDNPTTCAISTSSPTTYEPKCIGTVTVEIRVQPSSNLGPIDVSDKGTEVVNAT